MAIPRWISGAGGIWVWGAAPIAAALWTLLAAGLWQGVAAGVLSNALALGALFIVALASMLLVLGGQARSAGQRMSDTESRLRDSEARLELAMKVTALGLWDYRADTEAVGSNEQAARMLGYAPEEFVETRAAFVARLHPDDRARVRAAFRDYLQGLATEYACEMRMRTRDGHYRWFRSTGQVMARDAAGRPLRVVGTYLDITGRVEGLRRLSELSARLLDVQDAERRQLARELHDEIGQQLTALKLGLHAIAEAERDAEVVRRLTDCSGIVERTLDCIRARVLDLRPPLLDDMGLGATLDWYCRAQEERSEVCVMLDGAEALPRLDERVELAAFRIVQEAVNNALKHGGADELHVGITRAANTLGIRVRDNGRGFAPTAEPAWPGGIGLAAMRERVSLLGGRFELDSRPGEGTTIVASLPVAGGLSGE